MTVRLSSVASQSPGFSPTVSSPMSSERGARPVAKRISSAVTTPPSDKVTRTSRWPSPPTRSAPTTETLKRTSAPASRRRSVTNSPANGSIRGNSTSSWPSRVTLLAQGLPGGVHLDTHDTSADDHETLRQPLGAGRLPAGPGPQDLDPGQRGQSRTAAGAHGDGVPGPQPDGVAVGSLHGHLALPRQPPMAAQQVDAGRLDPLDLAVVLPVGGHAIAVRQDGLGLITGASSGLGKALAEHVLAHGGQVVATASSTQATTELAARYPETALAVRLDVTEPADREAAVRAAEAIHQAVSAPELAHWVVLGQRRPAAYRGQAGPGAGRVRGRPGVGVQYGLPGGRRQRGALSLTGNAAPVAGRGTCHRRRSSCGVWSARVGQTVMVLYSV